MAAPDFTSDEVVIQAGSLLMGRAHALADAVLAHAQQHAIALLSASHVEELPDQGLLGRVNGKISVLGKQSLLTQAGIDISFLAREADALHKRQMAVYFLSIGDHLAGLIAIPAQE